MCICVSVCLLPYAHTTVILSVCLSVCLYVSLCVCLCVGPGEQGSAVILSAEEEKKKDDLYKVNGFNAYVSDKISLDRSLHDIRHPESVKLTHSLSSLSLCLFLCLCVCLSVCLSARVSVSLCVSLSLFSSSVPLFHPFNLCCSVLLLTS